MRPNSASGSMPRTAWDIPSISSWSTWSDLTAWGEGLDRSHAPIACALPRGTFVRRSDPADIAPPKPAQPDEGEAGRGGGDHEQRQEG